MDHSTVKRLAIQSGFQPDSVVFLPMLHSFAEKVIENFLAETGQYVTNDASREAAMEQARAEEREACLRCYSPDDTAADWADKIRARGQK